MYKNILVALDYGPCMELVAKEAIEHAVAFGSKLILCHVKKNTIVYNAVDTMGMMTAPHVIQDHSYNMDNPFEKIKEEALAAGVKEVEMVQTHSSAPGIAIADTIAPGYEADLIITGRNDKSQLNRLLLGSVSSNIINYAACDVLLVRNNR